MTDRRCSPVQDVAAEFALGVLTGRERAHVLAHLQGCPACRRDIADLTDTVGDLRALLPTAEPPIGFEARVLTALGFAADTDIEIGEHPEGGDAVHAEGHVHRPARRRLMAAAALVLAVAVTWVAARALDTPPPVPPAASTPTAGATVPSASLLPPTASGPDDTVLGAAAGSRQVRFAPLIAEGRSIGQVYAYNGHPPWLYMALDADAVAPGAGSDEHEGPDASQPPASATVTCRLVHRQGPATPVGTFLLGDGYDSWGLPAGVGTDVVGAELTDDRGTVLATATFG